MPGSGERQVRAGYMKSRFRSGQGHRPARRPPLPLRDGSSLWE
jgi:hypothetical protein